MRIGSTILLKNRACVQSYEWSRLRPLGRLQAVVDELDCYECDEIAIIRPVRSDDNCLKLQSDLLELRSLKSMTPILFGGGLRTVENLSLLEGLPIERLIFTAAFLSHNVQLLESAIRQFGRQSIQCFLPVSWVQGEVQVFNTLSDTHMRLSQSTVEFIDLYANEIIIHDCANEGKYDEHDIRCADSVGIDPCRLVISGGIGDKTVLKASNRNVASVLIDNRTLHEEYSIAGYRRAANL